MKNPLLFSGLAAIIALHGTAVSAAKPDTDKEKFSYAIGFQIGQGFKRDNLEIDTKTMSQAINDVLNDKTPQLSAPEMRAAMEAAQQKLLAARAAVGEKAKAAGEAYLAANKKKKDVVTRDSGLQYKVISAGKGKQPTAESSITAHYKGTLIDGREFDSSYSRNQPATFNVNQVIPGWKEVLPLMHEGDKWQVFIPSELAYGERGSGNAIGPNETLIFEIELLKVN
ncbi:MAG TPA: FKBP-type peptidyl-prolyl cis-trans isomerase [Gammaproteobacteria bacterium]|nr:FKBP-type peptidyl-prolyl cis-trans isomerase [Gammaproteobacteria bacterium]